LRASGPSRIFASAAGLPAGFQVFPPEGMTRPVVADRREGEEIR
jgi:hypothetical protein